MAALPKYFCGAAILLGFATAENLAPSSLAQGVPGNDNFANPTTLIGSNGTQSGSTVQATSQPGEPLHAGETGGSSVWFAWTAPQSGRWFFRTLGSDFDTILAVYTGAAINALTEIASNDDAPLGGSTSLASFDAQAGIVYRVALDGYFGETGNYQLEWQAVLPPNDDLANATLIADEAGFRDGFNVGATSEAGEPHAGNSIWYRWTAPRNMQVVFSTSGSGFDTFLCAYTGSTLGSLTEIACNDNEGALTTSRLSFAAVSGSVYLVQLTGMGGAVGNARIHWNEEGVTPTRLLPDMSVMASQPLNYLYGWTIDQNQIPGRTLLRVSTATPNTGAGPLELRGTTSSPLVVQRIYRVDGTHEDRPAGSFTFHPTHGHLHFDDWVQLHLRAVLQGNGVGEIVASGNKTSFAIIDIEPHDTNLPGAPAASVYHGGLTQGLSVGWRDVYSRTLPDQWIDVTAVPPGQYWLEGVVDPENHIEESDETNNANRILITYAGAAPPNNHFVSATFLVGSVVGTTGKNHLGTKEAGEPAHAADPGGKSVWYRWTAPISGLVTISTEGSDFDTLLGIYTGSSVGNLTTIASNDDAGAGISASSVTFSAIAGTLYRIALDGKNGAAGSCQLAINPATNDLFAASRVISGTSGVVTGSSHGATQEPGEPAHAGTGGKSVWFAWTAPSSGEASFDTESSAFDTVLAVYSGSSVDSLTLIADDDDSSLGSTSRVVFTAVAGTNYRIALDGRDAAAGIHTLTWNVSASTAPYFLTHPEGADIVLGGTCVFSVVGGGSQPRQYQWWHNGTALVDDGRISGANTPELSLYKLRPNDSGSYHVVVTNAHGVATSNTATLIALANPRVIHADEVTADIGGVLSLPIGIQSQGNEHAIYFTVTLDPTTFLSLRAVLGPDAAGGTISLDLSQSASGRIGIGVALAAGELLAPGHREIAVIHADVSPSSTAGATMPVGFVSMPISASAATSGGSTLAALTAAGSVSLVRVFPTTGLQRQENGDMRVILHGLRGREYVAWRGNNLVDWLSFAQGTTGEDGIVEAIDPTASGATSRFYRWSLLPP
jgi:Lysyl oxidase/Immunoglobulin I-set domain